MQRHLEPTGKTNSRFRAHRGVSFSDGALTADYCGNWDRLDAAYARCAESYGAQTVVNYAAFVEVIVQGRVIAISANKG